jgi:hypothetical protein
MPSLNYIAAIDVQKKYYAALDKKIVEQKQVKAGQLSNINSLANDPYWINNVNYHASLSKHNYTKLY